MSWLNKMQTVEVEPPQPTPMQRYERAQAAVARTERELAQAKQVADKFFGCVVMSAERFHAQARESKAFREFWEAQQELRIAKKLAGLATYD